MLLITVHCLSLSNYNPSDIVSGPGDDEVFRVAIQNVNELVEGLMQATNGLQVGELDKLVFPLGPKFQKWILHPLASFKKTRGLVKLKVSSHQ